MNVSISRYFYVKEAKDELQRRCEQLEQLLKEQKQHSKSQNLVKRKYIILLKLLLFKK